MKEYQVLAVVSCRSNLNVKITDVKTMEFVLLCSITYTELLLGCVFCDISH